MTDRLLFARNPVLRELLPFVELATLPTPLDQVDDRLWVKRDDLTSPHYGGNKVRKLEFVLASPYRRQATLLTAGAVGSHHVHAVAVHGARLGLVTEAVVYDVAVTDDPLPPPVAHVWPIGSEYLMPIELARRLRPGKHVIMPGASTPLGVLGYVEGGLELAAQLPLEVDTVVAALGSGGTAVGLALGLALAGSPARVVAPLVSSALVANRALLAALEAWARALLALGGLFPPATHLETTSRFRGPGYGVASELGQAAAARGTALGIAVERTYTAKALAAAFGEVDDGRRVCFVQTWAGPVRHNPA